MSLLDIFTENGRERRKVERDYQMAEMNHSITALRADTVYLEAVSRHTDLVMRTQENIESFTNTNWVPPNAYDDDKTPDGYVRTILVKNIRQNKTVHPTIGNIIDNFRKYGIDSGANFSSADDDEIIQTAIDEYAGISLDTSVQKEYIERLVRDGEVFRVLAPGGALFLDPENIKTPTEYASDDTVSEGIRYEGQTPVEYYYYPNKNVDKFDVIPTEQLIHTKNGVDANQPRGEPKITSGVYNKILQYESLEKNRCWQVEIRSAVAVNQIVSGGASGMSTARQASQTDNDTNKTNKVKKFRAGTFIRSSPGVETRFESPNVQGADTEVVARAARLFIAASVGLPEHLLWADASNSNYSSTTAASREQWATVRDIRGVLESSLIEEVEYYLLWRGDLPATTEKRSGAKETTKDDIGNDVFTSKFVTETVPTTLAVKVEWPALAEIDDNKQADAVSKDLNNGLVSRRTAMVTRGYDPEFEEAQIAEERGSDDMETVTMQQRLDQEMNNNEGDE